VAAKADAEANAMNSRRDSPRFCVTADSSEFLVEGGLRGSRMWGIIPACTLFTVTLPHFQPLPLSRARSQFSHSDWLFEIKWDGFRALLYSDTDGVRLVSRNGNTFKSFPRLCEGLVRDLDGRCRCFLPRRDC
jgi:ATP-dependent DNA ligase